MSPASGQLEGSQTPVSAWGVWAALRGRSGQILRFALVFELLRFVLLAPLATGLLRISLERWGRCSVGNFEIISFLLSPAGLVGLVGVGTIALTTAYLELGGVLLLIAHRDSTWQTVISRSGKVLLGIVGLGLRQLLPLLGLAVPFGALAGGLLLVLWSGRDLNGLVVLRPPVFWMGVSIGSALLGIYALLAGRLLLSWSVALPILLLEPGIHSKQAMRKSSCLTQGSLRAVAGMVIGWLVPLLLTSSILVATVRLGSGWLLDNIGFSLPVVLPVTGFVLALHALTAAGLSVLGVASCASLLLVLYEKLGGTSVAVSRYAAPPGDRGPGRPGYRIMGAISLFVVITAISCRLMIAQVRIGEKVEITAHRGGAAVAPENTVAAIDKAIEARADWAEIDVQRTANGALVILHDADLDRVGGIRRRVAESTLEQIKAIDVGSRFGPAFAGVRVPTLGEVIAAAGDRIRLNIELKPNGKDDTEPLVEAVVETIRRTGMVGRCRLCSQSYDGLRLAHRLEPALPVGFIAGGRLGDLSKLDVNFLMVAERLATPRLSEQARARGIEVHAWTINNTDLLVSLIDRQVANIITDDPGAMRRRLEEITALSVAERLLLRARNLLAN